MITPISFTSSFLVKAKNNGTSGKKFRKFVKHANRIARNSPNEGITVQHVEQPQKRISYEIDERCAVWVPDSKDNSVSSYCKRNGIQFEKINVLDRKLAKPEERHLVVIDCDKFEKILDGQVSNIKQREKEYETRYKEDIYSIFKNDSTPVSTTVSTPISIPVTKICIFANDEVTSSTLRRYKNSEKSVVPNPNELQIFIGNNKDLLSRYSYFGYKDMAIKRIPVCMDNISYEFAKKLGIITDDLTQQCNYKYVITSENTTFENFEKFQQFAQTMEEQGGKMRLTGPIEVEPGRFKTGIELVVPEELRLEVLKFLYKNGYIFDEIEIEKTKKNWQINMSYRMHTHFI